MLSAPQRVAHLIVGGGLAGLYAAHRLEQQGLRDTVLLEARPTLGGRILSEPVEGLPERLDLGPTWYWPDLQWRLDQLVRALGLAPFEQHEHGDMLLERTPHAPPMRTPAYLSAPTGLRLPGGMRALTDALRARLGSTRILTGHTVQGLRLEDDGVTVTALDAEGRTLRWRAAKVLLALPPRLAMERLDFAPALPDALGRAWRDTPTWMAPHAKYVAVYARPFWREAGLSGEARSACGPLGEIHDACGPGGAAALFGFVGLPVATRQRLGEDALRGLCRAQLGRIFGPPAAEPVQEFWKDWAQDPLTAVPQDLQTPAGHHAPAPPQQPAQGPWQGRLAGIGSEWSPQFPGYLAGAVEAVERACG